MLNEAPLKEIYDEAKATIYRELENKHSSNGTQSLDIERVLSGVAEGARTTCFLNMHAACGKKILQKNCQKISQH